jgi:hypothetical protein
VTVAAAAVVVVGAVERASTPDSPVCSS